MATSASCSGSVGVLPSATSKPGVVLQHLDDERAGVLAFVLDAHRGHTAELVATTLLVEPVGHLHP